MRIRKLENIEQVKNLEIRDIIPMCDQSSMIDGRFEGMLTKKEGDTMIFLGRNNYEKKSWFIWLIPEATKNGSVSKRYGEYLFDAYKIKADIESIKEDDPEYQEFISKYKEETKQ